LPAFSGGETHDEEAVTVMFDGILSQSELDAYHEEGYLLVENLLSAEEVEAFLDHESRPQPPERRRGLLTHTVDPQWRALATHPHVAGVARQLLRARPMIVQTMYLNKPPNGGKGIALHQDALYLRNEPNTLMACWIALDDTDGDNGGLCVVPRSHRDGLRSAHLTEKPEEHVRWEQDYAMRDRDGREWTERLFSFEMDDLREEEILRLVVPRGGGVFFTGLTIHGSFANRSTHRPRRAFAVHYVAEGTWVYRQDVQNVVPAWG